MINQNTAAAAKKTAQEIYNSIVSEWLPKEQIEFLDDNIIHVYIPGHKGQFIHGEITVHETDEIEYQVTEIEGSNLSEESEVFYAYMTGIDYLEDFLSELPDNERYQKGKWAEK